MTVTKRDNTNNKILTNVSYTTKSFGEKLIELRNERGITQSESAEMIGISRNALSMYERCERCPNIDIAVNAANAYNVSLDYLFGTGYKKRKNNEYNMFDMGFSEASINFLSEESNRYYVDAILSDSRIQKIKDLLFGAYYKPLINSYEMNYISRLISDLLYCILVDVTKNTYKLRPMFDEEIEELLNTVDNCIRELETKEHLVYTDYDEYMDCCDTIQTELDRIKSLLENSPNTNYQQAFQDGFYAATQKFYTGEFQITTLDESEEKLEKELQKYIKKIPLKKAINMSTDEKFKEARRLKKEDERK